MSMPSESEMQTAVALRDKTYDELFFYGVITTGIFCRPSCSSRTAKKDNLRFFPNEATAMLAGFRMCKRCGSTTTNNDIQRLINVARHIENNAHSKLTLKSLGSIADLSATRLQRLFKETFGISPKNYQDAIRMNNFKLSLKNGNSVTDSIFSSGFGSVSRIYGENTRNIGMTPTAYQSGGVKEMISYVCRETTFGWMMIGATDKGLCFVQFADSEMPLLQKIKEEFPQATIQPSNTAEINELEHWFDALDQYINYDALRPDIPLDIRGTAFQTKVWNFLLSTNDSDVLNYSEVAKRIDKPKAVRAVASACAKNRIGVLIPCHRVIRSNGEPGGYRWGLKRKQMLLSNEQQRATNL